METRYSIIMNPMTKERDRERKSSIPSNKHSSLLDRIIIIAKLDKYIDMTITL